ncbi:MAG: hypothetical protein IKO33_01835 [Bacteroidaceae bacterium]|nr:hypothetical protein [Bacteroidaceae bacterium]
MAAGVVVRGSVYGGGNQADVQTDATVNISSGQVDGDVFGGGKGQQTVVTGDVTVNIGVYDDVQDEYVGTGSVGNVYGGSALGAVNATKAQNGDLIATGSKTTSVNVNKGTVRGSVFGGGLGQTTPSDIAAQSFGSANVTIGNADDTNAAPIIKGSVYGGSNENGVLLSDANVNIIRGTVGEITENEGVSTLSGGNVHGGGFGQPTLVQGNVTVNIGSKVNDVLNGYATIRGDVYGGSAKGNVNAYIDTNDENKLKHFSTSQTRVNLYGATEVHDIYGGGLGDLSTLGEGHSNIAANVYGPVTVTVEDGKADNIFGCNNLYGAPQDAVTVNVTGTSTPTSPAYSIANVYGGGNLANNTVSPTVNVSGKSYVNKVFGGGKEASIQSSAVNIGTDGTNSFIDRVFGGGDRADLSGNAVVSMTAGKVLTAVYGGCNAQGTVTGNTSVTLTGGTIGTNSANANVHGGGFGSSTYVKGNVAVQVGTIDQDPETTVTIWGDVYGGSAQGHVNAYPDDTNPDEDNRKYSTDKTTKVSLYAGTINGDAYGGGLGTQTYPAYVGGNIFVELNGNSIQQVADDKKGAIVNRIFGANNLFGSPKGNVTVNIYKTQNASATRITNTEQYSTAKRIGQFDVQAVYGGGNLAPYIPLNTSESSPATTKVVIEGCDRISINQVYGGGNAASVPASNVIVRGTFEINEVFGGGNGNDAYVLLDENEEEKHYNNPGANVGYKGYTHWDPNTDGSVENPFNPIDNTTQEQGGDATTKESRIANYRYGSGVAQTEIYAGKINSAYGGSNQKGNIRTTAISIYDEMIDGCPVEVAETYGGGKNAPMDGVIRMNLDCVENLPIVYGGAKNADVNSDIELNITNGTYTKVFGGNNQGGAVWGSITVKIKEEGCKPIIIGELYGGGYQAPYSIYGYKMVNGELTPLKAGDDNALQTPYMDPRINVISASKIGTIYGGGYQATVVGSPHINVNMEQGKVLNVANNYTSGQDYTVHEIVQDELDANKYNAILEIGKIGTIFGGGYEADIVGNTYVEIGTGECLDASGDYETVSRNTADITGNVYGGGNLANVTGNTYVNIGVKKNGTSYVASAESINSINIDGNVYGGGKGVADNFTCDKAMVGINNEGEGDLNPGATDKGTRVTIGNGTIKGNVYGGGEIGRVEWNTIVTIGDGEGVNNGDPTSAPDIKGSVFGAGKGVDTHGYSALVRGNSTVTVQGNAKIGKNVYGGGEIATVGRYWVKGIAPNKIGEGESVPEYPGDDVLAPGMPYIQRSGGVSSVTIQGNAIIGPETATDEEGHVYGAGKGVIPNYTQGTSQRWVKDQGMTAFANEASYNEFLQTLALVTNTYVTIGNDAKVKGSVYGGSENGFVQTNTSVTIQGSSEIGKTDSYGNIFGGGKGLATFGEAGKVIGNTTLSINNGTMHGSVYGGGELGDVRGTTNITMSNGSVDKNIYGGGKGLADNFTCDKAMVGINNEGEGDLNPGATNKGTSVSISNGTVYGNVYGGGEIGRVEWNTIVTIGDGEGVETGTPTSAPDIKGSVFGAGKGVDTHGYSALVRGNSTVTVQGNAKIGKNVYGGGEIATAGRYWVKGVPHTILGPGESVPSYPDDLDEGIPYIQRSGGVCSVTIQGHALIGPETATDEEGYVYGAGKGVQPHYNQGGTSQRWVKDQGLQPFANEDAYKEFLQTLAYATNTYVTIGNSAKIKGSVYGGSENGFVQTNTSVTIQGSSEIGKTNSYGDIFGGGKGLAGFEEAGRVSGSTILNINGGITHGSVYGGGKLGFVKSSVKVDINNGTIDKDVYGGGALAHTNTENWNGAVLSDTYHEVSGLTVGSSFVDGYYTKTGDNYIPATGTAVTDIVYYSKTSTIVNINGGSITNNVYGGALGDLVSLGEGHSNYAANVYGPVTVTVQGGKAANVFGANNLNGAPQSTVTVNVNGTDTPVSPAVYAIGSVYGGGNLADYSYIDGPAVTVSGQSYVDNVFGGGNQATVAATNVTISTDNTSSNINYAFGGGNEAGVTGNTSVNMTAGKVVAGLYGGNNTSGTVGGNTSVVITGGTLGTNWGNTTPTNDNMPRLVFGGGLGQATLVNGDVTVNIGTVTAPVEPNTDLTYSGSATIWGDVYGGSAKGNVNATLTNSVLEATQNKATKVNLYGGDVKGSLYGGGLGDLASLGDGHSDIEANVYGPVTVTAQGGKAANVFGANNLYGAPQSTVTVNINGTDTPESPAYAIGSVYGGGNQANYIYPGGPTVTVRGESYVENVFGGGNQATVDATNVTISAANNEGSTVKSKIGKVFGGGNQAGVTGTGNSSVNITSGNVLAAIYGGCNESGTIDGNVTIDITGGTIGNGTTGTFSYNNNFIPNITYTS